MSGAETTLGAEEGEVECPVCGRRVAGGAAQDHVNRCLFLNSRDSSPAPASGCVKRARAQSLVSPREKRRKAAPVLGGDHPHNKEKCTRTSGTSVVKQSEDKTESAERERAWSERVPLAERARPASLDQFVGQRHVLGERQLLRGLLEKGRVPSMILWGPPGCGKTSLANVVATICKSQHDMRFVKLSAAMSGIGDVKEVVNVAKNEAKFKRRTVLFMDEIHRFNKLQQDAFLPHVENGTIVLIGATTENPSFSLNNALLSRCRVVVLEKLSCEDILTILERALDKNKEAIVVDDARIEEYRNVSDAPRAAGAAVAVRRESLSWLAAAADGDARVALGSLQLALQSARARPGEPAVLELEHFKEALKRSHVLYERRGDRHYDMASALHKSVRASDDNAALYWTARMLRGGEDPLFIARRLVRAASEDIGLADPSALPLAVSCMQGCRLLGAPECDVLLAQCAVQLARAPKSQEAYRALLAAKEQIAQHQGALPSVPLHLRNASTELTLQLGYGEGYNMRHKEESDLQYMPPGLEHLDFFSHP